MKKKRLVTKLPQTNFDAAGKTVDKLIRKVDGWNNIQTGLGRANKDKRLAAVPEFLMMDQLTAESVYRGDDLGAKIVDKVVYEMLRECFKVKVKENPEWENWIREKFQKFGVHKKLCSTNKWARLYGGAGIVMGINDGQNDPLKPLSETSIKSVDYMVSVDRYHLITDQSMLQDDPSKPNFLMPDKYMLQVGARLIPIHSSRVIRFDGVELPLDQHRQNQFWGASVLERVYEVVRDFQASYGGVAHLMTEMVIKKFKMKNLLELLTSKRDDLIVKRFQLVNSMVSFLNAVVIQDDEEFERDTASVAGVAEILEKFKDRLAAATDIPKIILFNEAPSGLGSNGSSQLQQWYDYVRSQQRDILMEPILRIAKLMFLASDSPSAGKVPEMEVEFPPLMQPSEKEKAETRKINAEIDEINIRNQVYDPEEVAYARYTPNGYSDLVQIDTQGREAAKAPEEEASSETETQSGQETEGYA